ncbi:hypothetical protein GCM10011594_20820 [Nakamurella endophytica]|uniref:Uncharacterized protein n=1 Tax=Nakamurella endophytica TaxID=1748367 RepID=A0A917SX69_9ACTN|nr:hypothetical protein GCM10011594_20820 [Nakamurella endophytica]
MTVRLADPLVDGEVDPPVPGTEVVDPADEVPCPAAPAEGTVIADGAGLPSGAEPADLPDEVGDDPDSARTGATTDDSAVAREDVEV